MAAELGKRGSGKTAKRGAEYYSYIAELRKTKAGGRPKKNLDALSNGATPDSVCSRAASPIVRRVQAPGMDTKSLAEAIHASEQYVRNVMQGVTIQSDEKLTALIRVLKLNEMQATDLRQMVAADRVRNDGRFNKV